MKTLDHITKEAVEEFENLWQEMFNSDYLIRDWEDHGRNIQRFLTSQLSSAYEKGREDLLKEIINSSRVGNEYHLELAGEKAWELSQKNNL